MEVEEIINPKDDDFSKDAELSELTAHPGWKQVEEQFMSEIERLKNIPYMPGDTMEQHGLKVFAAQMAKERLERIVNHVRGTAATVAEREE